MSASVYEQTTTWLSARAAPPLWRNMRGLQGYGSLAPGRTLGGISPTSTIQGYRNKSNFDRAIVDAVETAAEMHRAAEMALPNESVWNDAIAFLQAYAMVLGAPLITPLQGGGLSAEWHEHGLNIELRFRKDRDVFAVIEDARGEIEAFMARDPDLDHAAQALNILVQRLS